MDVPTPPLLFLLQDEHVLASRDGVNDVRWGHCSLGKTTYQECRRRALTTAPKLNTVAPNMKTPRETDSGAPDTPIRTQRIVPTSKPNQMPNSSSERRLVTSNCPPRLSPQASSLMGSHSSDESKAAPAIQSHGLETKILTMPTTEIKPPMAVIIPDWALISGVGGTQTGRRFPSDFFL